MARDPPHLIGSHSPATIFLVALLLTLLPKSAQSSPQGDCLDTFSKKVKGAQNINSPRCPIVLRGANAYLEGEGALLNGEIWLFKGTLSVTIIEKGAKVVVHWKQQKFTVTGKQGSAVFWEYNDRGTSQNGLMLEQTYGVTTMSPPIQFLGDQPLNKVGPGEWIGMIEPIIEKVTPPAPCPAFQRFIPIRIRFHHDGSSREEWEVVKAKEEKCDLPVPEPPADVLPPSNMGCSCGLRDDTSSPSSGGPIWLLFLPLYIIWIRSRRTNGRC